MHITLIEPFHTGSHRQWAEGLQRHSSHEVEILSLKGRHWKWRMFGGAVALARMFVEKKEKTDLILATDMLDLSTFLGLTREKTTGISVAIYFHENQLTYPWSPTDQDVQLGRNNEYAFKNYTSALAADKVFFNSQYHLDSFIDALDGFLKQFPDTRELQNIEIIKNKSEVLYLGMELSKFDDIPALERRKEMPVILWNHRWEYDKCPEDFFELLFELKKENIPFQLVVLGEKYKRYPEIFDIAQKRLKEEILHFGYAESKEAYAQWLHFSDILPVTSNQDFFGGSIIEAMYTGNQVLLPNRLAYPEHIPKEAYQNYIYQSKEELYRKLKKAVLDFNPNKGKDCREFVEKYDWKNCIESYDEKMRLPL